MTDSSKKVLKNFFVFLLLIILFIFSIIFIYSSSQTKINNIEKQLEEQEKQAETYKEKIEELEKEIFSLEEKNQILESTKNKFRDSSSTYATYQQTMNTLSDIFILIENNQIDKARDELKKLDFIRLDETALNYKKALNSLIEK